MKRRSLLIGTLGAAGALVVGWGLLPPRQRQTLARPGAMPAGEFALNGWLRLGQDNSVTVMLAKSEMGQGVSTALAMVLADELDAHWPQVRTAQAPMDAIYNNQALAVDGLPFHPDDAGWARQAAGWLAGKAMRDFGLMVTGGSTSVKDLWQPMREAGAAARSMLLAAAAEAWDVPKGECQADEGLVRHLGSGRQLRYGELAAAAARQPLPQAPTLKKPAEFKLIGRPLLRRDAADKQLGTALFGLDTRQPDMLYANVQMCPTLGGSVASVDPKAVLALPGVRHVVTLAPRFGSTGGLAVVADTPWRAIQGARAVAVRWDHGPAAKLNQADIDRQLDQALAGNSGQTHRASGDVAGAFARAARTVQADYRVPLLAHATLEPQNCTVLYDPAARLALVWAPTQVPGLARRAVAKVLGLDTDQVQLMVTLLGGGFGRRLEVDVVAQAAQVAMATPGVPVQTFWTRDQDSTHDMYRPPAVARWQAALDAEGRITGLKALSAGPSVVHQFIGRQFGLPGLGADKTVAEGASDQAYEWPALHIAHQVVETAVPVGFWRSVGHSHQAFFKESFIDECAHAAQQDPLDFRLRLLQRQPRHREVLQRVAAAAGWHRPSPPAPDGAPTAWGLALHRSFGSIVAQAAQVSVDPAKPGRIRVHRVAAAIDCGTVVNPNLVRQQMESAIVFGLSAALHGEVTIQQGQVQQTNFHDQPLLRLSECPQIQTDIISSDHPPEGVGEPGTPPIAPAVANALFRLTGQRLRRLPLRLA